MLRREDICRSILASFAINISTLTSTYLDREDLSDAVILSDKMHNEYFYLSIQVTNHLNLVNHEGFYAKQKRYFLQAFPIFKLLKNNIQRIMIFFV
jgi:hypothetical protein